MHEQEGRGQSHRPTFIPGVICMCALFLMDAMSSLMIELE